MKTVFQPLLAIMVCALAVSCNSVSYKKTKSGLMYKIYPGSNKDSALREGDWLKFNFVTRYNDSVVQSSYGEMPAYVRYTAGQQAPYNPAEIFGMLKKGDSAVTVMMVDTLLKRGVPLPPNFKKGDRLITSFTVLEVFRNDSLLRADQAVETEKDKPRQEQRQKEELAKYKKQLEEQMQQQYSEYEKEGEVAKGVKAMQDYLASKNINAQMVGKGTFVVIKEQGTGAQAAPEKFVTVKYTGSLVRKDSTFDAGTFTRQLGVGALIPGMEEGLEAFKQGGKGTLYVPGFRAYGKSHPKFQPFEAMKFDVEILNVADTMAATAERPMPIQ
ncbi:MAG: FKBP-type peptidyl-prolyl cis-trans isomerase [Chitinophagaceae bacterium]|nr:FKBP-type peptidyl-prolyl cis-trans isomerase [Chitinophagaceae bacterium]